MLKTNFRGLDLCEACWNGAHFVPAIRRDPCEAHKTASLEVLKRCKFCSWKKLKKLVNNCAKGDCECPCSRMEQNRADQTFMKRVAKVNTKKAQTSLLDRPDALHIGPNS